MREGEAQESPGCRRPSQAAPDGIRRQRRGIARALSDCDAYMRTNTLTDARIRALKPAEKLTKHFDGGGLFLAVTPKGAKVWRLAYRVDGKPQTLSIGPYPLIGLAEARARRDDAKRSLLRGEVPGAKRQPQKPAGPTLGEACAAYWAGRHDVSDSYRENATRGITMHLAALLDRPVGSITRADLLAELKLMDAAGLFEYVRKVRGWVSQVFEWAVEHQHAEHNPAAEIKPGRAFGAAPVEHFAALELREVPGMMERVGMEDPALLSVLALKLLALTWVRTGELRMMEWAEIDGDTWVIPRGKMKRRLDHLVPLPRQAVTLLAQLRARTRSRYVFPGERTDDRPISENAVLALLARCGYKGKMTGHGFRTVGSTWANEHGWPADAIERQLGHVPKDEVRAAYNRAKYLPVRREMLQAFADWLVAPA